MSGISLSEAALNTYNDMKLKHMYGAVSYMIEPEKKLEVVVDKTYPVGTPLDTIAADLPPKDCRFITYDVHLDSGYSSVMEKLVFI